MTLSIKIKSLKDFKNKNILIYMDRNVLKKKSIFYNKNSNSKSQKVHKLSDCFFPIVLQLQKFEHQCNKPASK